MVIRLALICFVSVSLFPLLDAAQLL